MAARPKYEVEEPSEAALDWSRITPVLPLLAILAVTVVVFADSLTSPLYGDDYIYLVAAREMSFSEYAKAAFTPWGHEPLLPFTRDLWRPLSFLWFEVSEPVFGGHVFGYHMANLGAHLTSVVLVWCVAARLDARPAVRSLAAALFALYPGSFEAVTWISSFNSVGLVFALASWLVFLSAAKPEFAVRWPLAITSAVLVALGLCFRETSVALLPAMALWYLLVQRRARIREWRTYLPFAPFAAVGLIYYLIRTRFVTEPFANPDVYAVDSDFIQHWWYYVRNALLPFREPVEGWRLDVQRVFGALLLLTPVVALLRRRWDMLALTLGLLISILPLGATLLGIGQRYFYFSSAVLALIVAILAADALHELQEHGPPFRRWALPMALAAVLAMTAFSSVSRIEHWEDISPEREQAWVEGLRGKYPELPAGGTLYCSNVPVILAVFGAANLDPTVRWYYPEVGLVVRQTEATSPRLEADDRFYDAGLPGVTLAQP